MDLSVPGPLAAKKGLPHGSARVLEEPHPENRVQPESTFVNLVNFFSFFSEYRGDMGRWYSMLLLLNTLPPEKKWCMIKTGP